jgi:glycosyltransferase involved in cell wall biosynthesis
VSVVVATHDRAHQLGQLVGALQSQSGVGPFEVIIVDDASTDDTWAVLQRICSTSPCPLRPLRLAKNSGPATARNAGWRAARAPLVVFTDDDCIPQSGWLAAVVDGLDKAELVQGQTIPIPELEPGRGPFSRSVWVEEEQGRYETCNVGYRRAVLEDLGGFDEQFGSNAPRLPALPDRDAWGTARPTFGEDMDLAWRAKESGARSLFKPDALVYHDVYPSSYLAFLRDKRRRDGMVRALSRHPGLRRHLHLGVFYQKAHPSALLAALGIGLLARRPMSLRRYADAALLILPYVHHRTFEDPLPCQPHNRIPVTVLTLVADLAEIGVLAASSIRYRTLLL